MKCVVPVPPETVEVLKRERETGPGYQIVSVELKDGRRFDQVVASEGCVIAVHGYLELPFETSQVVAVRVNHKWWNFRKWSDATGLKGMAAPA
jgi:hypothetical protein